MLKLSSGTVLLLQVCGIHLTAIDPEHQKTIYSQSLTCCLSKVPVGWCRWWAKGRGLGGSRLGSRSNNSVNVKSFDSTTTCSWNIITTTLIPYIFFLFDNASGSVSMRLYNRQSQSGFCHISIFPSGNCLDICKIIDIRPMINCIIPNF